MLERIAQNLNLPLKSITKVLELFEEGATIPFVARYRKEATGGLDEVQLLAIKEEWEKQQNIEKRQETILKAIESQDKLTDELATKIRQTFDLNLLEDIYLPYKKKRLTRAAKAKAKGLEPLADLLWAQNSVNISAEVKKYLTDEVLNDEEALQGARDIIAERINEHEKARSIVRQHFERRARAEVKVVEDKKEEGKKYSNYFEFDKALNKVQPHQLLAFLRAEYEGVLRLNIAPDEERVLDDLDGYFIYRDCPNNIAEHIEQAIGDAYKRLLKPSISRETLNQAKEAADEHSIHIFAENLRHLLLASPLGNKRILAIDPGYATGCKVVCLSATGDLLEHTVIYPTPPKSRTMEAEHMLQTLVAKHNIEAIAVGNGTAGRETETFVRGLRFGNLRPSVFLINESGASVYSASAIARQEFPDHDVTVRGAVSIGRRLMDPLAELVKIDPKSIGVGQYQHDVDQYKLQSKLGAVVESCVNSVGVDLNTASEHLLTYVSGLGPSLARNIVEHRKIHGKFSTRKELKEVRRLGNKAFEQAAGFLRIRSGKNPLDNTAVHPESYPIVEQMAKDLGTTIERLLENPKQVKEINLKKYCTAEVGLPTLQDIVQELQKPGRDPRPKRQSFEFANIHDLDEVREGMSLPGIVTNLTAFGAFVDIGIKQNGLIHKSKMSHRFVNDPAEVLKLGEELEVRVIGVDRERGRIQLSLVD